MSDEVCGQGSAVRRGKRPLPWRRDPEILARLRIVDRMRLKGATQAEIATACNVSEATVRDDLKRANELWLDRLGDDQATHRASVLAELEDVRIRALEAAEWDQMCERAVLFDDLDEPEATTLDGKPAKRSVYRDAKGSAQFRGNKVAALAQARQATMDKAKILGIDVSKVALTDSQGDDIGLDELMERFGAKQPEPAP